jgi:hypothetical protein
LDRNGGIGEGGKGKAMQLCHSTPLSLDEEQSSAKAGISRETTLERVAPVHIGNLDLAAA